MGALKKGGWNPLTNYDNTNYNLYKYWTYIFSWRYSPVNLSDILYLASDSLLKHLCCYFLLFLGRWLASLLCVCKNSIKTPSYNIEKHQKLLNNFFWYWHRKLFSNLLLSYSVSCPHHMSDVHFFFYRLLRLLFINDQMKSQVLPLKFLR